MKNYTDIKINSLPERELEIVGSITAEKMATMREKALAKIKENFETDGFRKGNAPESIIIQKVGEMAILEEAAEMALTLEYPNILDEHKIDAIGRPEIAITKIGVGAPLEFKVKTALMPDVKLGDYKKIAKKEGAKETKTPDATDKEVDDVIINIQKNIAHQKLHSEPEQSEGNKSYKASATTEGAANHDHAEIADADLPPVDDNFAKMIGAFADVADMKAKIKENIIFEKGLKEKDKKRTETLEAVMDASTIDLPKIIIDSEMEKMLAQFKDDIAKSGVSFDDYLKHIKKTEADLRAEWRDTAVKRAKSQVILNTIAKDESIAPKEEEIKKEMENILRDKAIATTVDRFRVRMYVETFLTNELVFQFLESQK